MKKILLLCSLWASVASAQSGTYKATPFPENALKLQWQHPGMQRTEALGDALIAKASGAAVVVGNGQRQIAAWQLRRKGKDVQVWKAAKLVCELQAWDSGHLRGWHIRMAPGEHWVGSGERSLPLLRNGQRVQLYNNPHYGYELDADELNYAVPFVMSTAGYGLLFDNPSKGYLDFGRQTPGVLEAAFESGELNVYIIAGSSLPTVLSQYSALTGRQPLPPRWALGNFVSRFGYRSQAQTEDVIKRMQADSFPIDAVVIDIFWFGDSIKGTLGNLDWVNRSKWPQPQDMMARFRQQHIHTVLVTEPFFLKNTRQFESSLPYLATDTAGKPYMLTKFYFGYGGLIDLFRPDAAQWFWQFYKKHTDSGVAGWWGDLGEPENHPADMLHNLRSKGVNRPVAANEVHNLYGHQWSKLLYENWTKTYPAKRLFFLNRAGFAGSQRYSILPWTGDVSRTWNGLKAQLPNLQSMSLSGVPYIHSDAGGFSNVPDNDQELYVRWLQMAAFTPVFRPHGTAFGDLEAGVNDLPSEPTFKDEPYKSIARHIIRQRYQLLPYLYSMAWQQSTRGLPLIRPMLYAFGTDSAAANATNQYMFGDALLVAPVTDEGARQQAVYVPAGQWYHWHSGAPLTGGGWQALEAPLERLPVLVKAGSLLPTWPDAATAANTAAYSMSTPLQIRYYAGTSQQPQWLYDDDGQHPQALQQKQAHQLLKMQAVQTGTVHRISISAANWPAGSSRSLRLLPIGLSGQRFTVSINGKTFQRSFAVGDEVAFSFSGAPLNIVLQSF
jgi:oligosaccharide 4-alpha-D-glucosyltransferase